MYGNILTLPLQTVFNNIELSFIVTSVLKNLVVYAVLKEGCKWNAGRDGPVGLATRYKLDGPGFESWSV
jgi:hypothetical protein